MSIKKASHKPNIYEYHDYREYLKDWVAYKKATQSSFSIRWLSAKTGISVGYMNMVISGKRNLSDVAFEKLQVELKLTSHEINFFNVLKTITDSNDSEKKANALKLLQRFKKYKNHNKMESEAFKYLNRWYYIAIREMADIPGFVSDPKWIQDRLNKKVSLADIREALTFLETQGFLIENEKTGRLESTGKHIECKDGIYRISLGEFYRQMFQLATESIDEVNRNKRLLNSHTVAITKNEFSQVKQILEEALTKISKLNAPVNEDSEVYHIGLQAFPLTLKKEMDE